MKCHVCEVSRVVTLRVAAAADCACGDALMGGSFSTTTAATFTACLKCRGIKVVSTILNSKRCSKDGHELLRNLLVLLGQCMVKIAMLSATVDCRTKHLDL